MVEIKSIEQLLYFMKGNVHLSRYDEKFIDNLANLKQVTTNQVVLFHTLVFKYKRQLSKHDLFVEKLVDLPWNVKVVESSTQYTDGHVSTEKDLIIFKCPFNRNFIDEFRKLPYNQFIWSKEKRHYESPYNQYSLKILLNTAPKFFDTINLCPISQKLLEEVKQYSDIKYWSPTMVNINERLYIAGMNASLNDALGNIELNTELKTMATLASYGVIIDNSLVGTSVRERIAANSSIEIEQSDLPKLASTLKELECDMVYISGAGLVNVAKKTIMKLLDEFGIKYTDTSVEISANTDHKFPVLIKLRKNFGSNYDPCKLAKVIHVVNSIPIEVK